MSTRSTSTAPSLVWDIFCRVIDNFGDIGVALRLCRQLAAKGHTVRLWVDDASALDWMAPGAREGCIDGIEVLPWEHSLESTHLQERPPADVWVETFGCEIAPYFIAFYVRSTRAEDQKGLKFPVWINLEYLSAEGFARRCHRLASPVMQGPARGATKFFYYPGFTADSGSLLREDNLALRQAEFDAKAWLQAKGIAPNAGPVVSLFCYEPDTLPAFLRQLANSPCPCTLLVTAGRANAAMRAAMAAEPSLENALRVHYLPTLSQTEFDHLLWASDFNCVRGEDSLVRALWAGKPFVWNIYPQDDNAHHAKLDAFLDWMEAPPSLRELHAAWNLTRADATLPNLWQEMPAWTAAAHMARARLMQTSDLCSQLVDFVLEKR
jgi:uncharacterized repeat protein (TIGR03837 family)